MATPAAARTRSGSYTAPALEKGLDILELLAGAREPLSARAIADALGRSKNEIFRMVYVLVERGYLQRDPASDLLSLSNRLFDLGMRAPRSRDLVEVALPAMKRLGDTLGLSVHLVVVNRGETVVIAAASGAADIAVTLRLGYRRPAIDASSGLTIIAFQEPSVRSRMILESASRMGLTPDIALLEQQLDRIRAGGFLVADSHDVVGITDLCAPILDGSGRASASLVVPAWRRRHGTLSNAVVRDAVVATAGAISAALP